LNRISDSNLLNGGRINNDPVPDNRLIIEEEKEDYEQERDKNESDVPSSRSLSY
jgi:hypothetical protein